MLKYPPINQSSVFVLNCMHCSFHTLLLSSLQEHIRDMHPNQDNFYSLYQCEHCGIISTSSNLLIEHTSLMHGDKQASVTCIYQASQNDSNKTSNYSCLFCEHVSVTSPDLALHYLSFHGIKNVSSVHLKSRNAPGKDKSKPVQLDRKPFQSDDQNGQNTIIDSSVNGSLNASAARDIANNESSDGTWKCKSCGKEYDKKKYFVEHMIACAKSLKLVCLCGRTCKWRSNFYAHRKRCPVYNSQLPKQIETPIKRAAATFSNNAQNANPTAVSSGMVFSPTGQLIGIRTGAQLATQAPPGTTLFPINTSLVHAVDPSQLQGATVQIKAESTDGSGVPTTHLYYTTAQIATPTLAEVTASTPTM